ncbi:MAG: iron-containing alcohol dehydrogenase [Bacteroidota bacterium]
MPSTRSHTDETAGLGEVAILVSVGSGTVTDVVRMAAHRAGKPFVAVPTAASMDGYTSPVVPMFNDGLKQAVPATPPAAVVGDLDLVATAPRRMASAGFGDLVGKFTARFDWTLAHRLTGEHFCGPTADLSRTALAKAAADPGGK